MSRDRDKRKAEDRIDALRDALAADGSGSDSGYTADDFREGNFTDTDPYTPLSRRQAKHLAALTPGSTSEAEIEDMIERSVETAIDRLENPEEHPDPTTRTVPFNAAEKSREHGDGLTDEQREAFSEIEQRAREHLRQFEPDGDGSGGGDREEWR